MNRGERQGNRTDTRRRGDGVRNHHRRTGDRNIKAQAVEIGEGEHGTGGNSGWSKDWTRGVIVTTECPTCQRCVPYMPTRPISFEADPQIAGTIRPATPGEQVAVLQDGRSRWT